MGNFFVLKEAGRPGITIQPGRPDAQLRDLISVSGHLTVDEIPRVHLITQAADTVANAGVIMTWASASFGSSFVVSFADEQNSAERLVRWGGWPIVAGFVFACEEACDQTFGKGPSSPVIGNPDTCQTASSLSILTGTQQQCDGTISGGGNDVPS